MFTEFFIKRPIAAAVLSILTVLLGGIALTSLPVAQYPEITPPTVSVTTTFPGAGAQTVADTVASEIEKEVNGVEDMLYMSSVSTSDGMYTLNVTFEVGTDLDNAQVLTQNRVSTAEAKLPDEVKRNGVTTKKKSPSITLCVNLVSPDSRYDQLYLSNFATLQVKDELARLPGVGDVTFLGEREYSMRVWLDPDRLSALDLTASDVVAAIREQNVQVAAGRLGQQPAPDDVGFQYSLSTRGRLLEAEEFERIIVKTGDDGRVARLRDVARIELGARSYDVDTYLDGDPTITLAVFQLPGSNAVETAEGIYAKMAELEAGSSWPSGLDYEIVYDTTQFIEESITSVVHTLIEAFVLVFLVVLVFLQNWRATIIPMVAVPVSLIGTFIFMALFGFSLNNLSLFGLVLAIGIVVDDAIVVVENVERNLALGFTPREATSRAMTEVIGPIIATTFVMLAVFVPVAFISGISGRFYQQFALTIAVSTALSAFNSLTLSPALCAILLKPHQDHDGHAASRSWALPRLAYVLFFGYLADALLGAVIVESAGLDGAGALAARAGVALAGAAVGWFVGVGLDRLIGGFFRGFNLVFEAITKVYGRVVGGLIRLSALVLVVYVGLLGLTYLGFRAVPVGFIPSQDKGYLVVNAQLPDAASLGRTEAVVSRLSGLAREIPGVAHTIDMVGYSALNATNQSNVGSMFVVLEPFEERAGRPELSADAVLRAFASKTSRDEDAIVSVFGAPPVEGLGSVGGFKQMVQDRADLGPEAIQGAVANLVEVGSGQPAIAGLFSSYRADVPQYFIDIDRDMARSMGVPLDNIFETLQIELGSLYVNQFTRFGRNWQVNVQADSPYRLRPDQIAQLKTRGADGKMVPIGALAGVREIGAPTIVERYNMFPAAAINGAPAPGASSGQAVSTMERLASGELPRGMGTAWTELTLLQKLEGNTAIFVFPFCVLCVFLVLAFQYESWSLPLSIVLIVPMCLLCAIGGVYLAGMDNNIFTQIGLVVLVALATKNAILIVEFAREKESGGLPRREAAVDASMLRLRPILMTSFAFILGVVPLVRAVGAGAEMRRALGVAVFSGMLGVTAFGILLTPVFYVVIRALTSGQGRAADRPGGENSPPVPVGVGVAAGNGDDGHDGLGETAPRP
ncbi:efflux RND transporter permease subunit [Tautonia plasticadhaerens]|uniref:Efflux pump membrane transporter BepE n=1 Tax=Tautonia plasticadhaerens TaxID=2527974 RepID=A0A518GVU6_9BACT|nr:multidrug efflux RND transporter permease subunit [Tautonia plasticadhaerens]QDV32722.1 Efflux pump membrane transporter BepE [Tautonia plasticadhaerens]